MRSGLLELKSDTWAIIGAGATMATIMMTVMLALNASTNARISGHVDRLDARISEQGERLDERIDAQEARIDMLYDTMRNEHALILESLAGDRATSFLYRGASRDRPCDGSRTCRPAIGGERGVNGSDPDASKR